MRWLRGLIVAALCFAPVGAGAWWKSIQQVGVSSAPAVTWNPADKNANISLSGGNLTATATATSSYMSFRGTAGHSTGKYYFEINPSVSGDGFEFFGIGNSSAGLSLKTGGTLDSVSARLNDGNVYINNSVVGAWVTTGLAVAGDTVGIAVDFGNSTIWFRKIHSGTSAPWNAGGTADPATNTGGYSISGLNAGPYFPMATEDFTSDVITANFAGSFLGTAPSGFGVW